MIKYLIIEKDKNIIKNINEVLKDFNEFNYIGATNDDDSSMNIILKDSPDLIFINLDGIIDNPFNFIKELNQFKEIIPEFIGISSSKENAYKAIKSNFFDFYLTPVKELEVRKSVLRFQKKKSLNQKKTVCLKSYRDYQYIETDEILFLKADNNTTDIYLENGKIVNAFKTLKTFEKSLPGNFIRIHKSYIINKDYVSRVNFGKSICSLKLENNIIPFTHTYIDKVKVLNNDLNQSSISA